MSRTVLSRAVLSRTLSLALYCSVSRNYNQPNMAAAESEGITHCFPGTLMGTLDSTSPIRIKGNFGDERYRFVEVTNILPTCAELMVWCECTGQSQIDCYWSNLSYCNDRASQYTLSKRCKWQHVAEFVLYIFTGTHASMGIHV